MDTPASSPLRAERARLFRRLWFWALCFPVAAVAVDQLMRHVTVPMPLEILLALVPLAPAIMFFRVQTRAWSLGDELEVHIGREALVFAFYGQIVLYVCVDLLRNAGVLPYFQWTTRSLVIALAALVLLGSAVARLRYR
ncbi:MAG TPA: hypothetical protein VHF69_14580 [Candidatus Synoicihabitans sp.]|nr:hypothetical protein [Candidatus Synoicihabitans sp.]